MTLRLRVHLLSTACTSVLAIAALPALAQEVSVIDANALITATQTNNGTSPSSLLDINGSIDTSYVGMWNDAISGTTVDTIDNSVASKVMGNEAVLSIISTVNMDTAGGTGAGIVASQTGSAGTDLEADATATANLAIGVVQTNSDVSSQATTNSTVSSINTGAVGTSTIDVTDNTQQSSGALNFSQNAITTTANGSNLTAGIATSQVDDGSSLALTSNSLAGISVGDASGEGVTDSGLTISGNIQTAFGSGNYASNSVTATVTNAALAAVVGYSETTTDATADVLATYSVGSAQMQSDATLSAITDGAGSGFELYTFGGVDGSTLLNNTNTASSKMRGNDAANAINLTLTNVKTETAAASAAGTVAAIGNAQNFSGTILAETMGTAGVAVETAIGAALIDSTVSTSSNRVTADATANISANKITVAANDVNTGLTASPNAVVDPSSATGDAAFAVSSLQEATGSVSASLVDDPTAPTSGARIETSVTGDINGSTVTSDLNVLSASATGNAITSSTNAIDITGTNVQTTTALANNQSLLADVSAVVGAPGRDAVLDTNYTADVGNVGTGLSTIGSDLVVNSGGSVTISLASITDPTALAAYRDAFGAAGFVVDTVNNTVSASGGTSGATFDLSAFNNILLAGQNITVGDLFVPGTPAVPLQSGVTIAAGANILDSTLSVDGNRTEGRVTGNTATNRISVTAANLDQGSTLTTAGADLTAGVATASADNALTNSQEIGSQTLTTNVSGAFAITQSATTAVESSTLSVSGNSQLATTTGNEGVNRLVLSATNLDSTGALLSVQDSAASVSATSNAEIYAPAATLDSTVEMNRNVNQAVATINTASNTMSITAESLNSVSSGANAVLDATLTATGQTQGAAADNVLNNIQSASTSVAATSNTTVLNGDGGIDYPTTFDSAGIRNSTISLDANRTVAQSIANSSVNSMSLDAGSTLAATGGVLNQQLSTATSTATASSTAQLEISATSLNEAVDSSTVSVDGNQTTAQASGNVASNALNVAALSLTATGAGSSTLNSGVSTADGTNSTYGVLNNQDNAGAVTATVSEAIYGGIFGSSATPSVSASSLTLNGNSVAASAVGNSASNNLTLASLNYGTSSAAIGNEQSNTANITATITEARLVLDPVGVGASTLSSIGNSITSSAVGNSVVSTLIRN